MALSCIAALGKEVTAKANSAAPALLGPKSGEEVAAVRAPLHTAKQVDADTK